MPMNAPQFEALLKEVCDAFVDAKKDGKIDAGDMIRVGLLAAGKVGVLKNLSAAEKKAVVLELLEKGLKSLGPKPLGLDEAISVEVEKQLMTAAGAAIDMALMSLKARSMFSYQLCCAGPADVDVGAFVAPAVPSVAAAAVVAVAAEKVLDLSGSSVVAVAAAVIRVVWSCSVRFQPVNRFSEGENRYSCTDSASSGTQSGGINCSCSTID